MMNRGAGERLGPMTTVGPANDSTAGRRIGKHAFGSTMEGCGRLRTRGGRRSSLRSDKGETGSHVFPLTADDGLLGMPFGAALAVPGLLIRVRLAPRRGDLAR